jgi:hypothetical protein
MIVNMRSNMIQLKRRVGTKRSKTMPIYKPGWLSLRHYSVPGLFDYNQER